MSSFGETEIKKSESDSDNTYGKGDRSSYYNKWDNFANVAVKKVEEEDNQLKEESNKLLGKSKDGSADSAQHKKDLEKRKALQEAKKLWDNVKKKEQSEQLVIEGLVDTTKLVNDTYLTEVNVGAITPSKTVVYLKDNSNSTFIFPPELKLIKIFVENCSECTIKLSCSIITGHIEVARCKDLNVYISDKPINTVQIDMSENINLHYSPGVFAEETNSKVYHSDVKKLHIEYDILDLETKEPKKVQDLNDFELAEMADKSTGTVEKDRQFVTQFIDGELTTDLVVRDNMGPTTMREIEAKKTEMIEKSKACGIDVSDRLKDFDPLTTEQLALQHKNNGNISFKDSDYMQAILHYTEAIATIEKLHPPVSSNNKEVLVASFSNRAACSLKLGDHTTALSDACKCLELEPNHVKATFRKGISLHALGRYREACPVLSKALEQQPKNEQIKTALMFSERKAR